jgi:hypothetical protein
MSRHLQVARPLRLLVLPALLVAGLAGPAYAEPNNGGGPQGPTVEDLSKQGYICTTFHDVYLICKDPSGRGGTYVCAPNNQCVPYNPQQSGGRGGGKLRLPKITTQHNLTRH